MTKPQAYFTHNRRGRWLDGLWLAALTLFIIAGMPLATFHGDESMQVYMSHDYAKAFIYGDPLGLMVGPPYYIDTDPWLRILNGSINRHAIGLSWQIAGYTNGDLPPVPGWDWGLDYATNLATNHRPVEGLLLAARASSTLFLAASALILFGIGWQLGGRPLAYLSSAIYTLNPVILLNGRRAMMEGSMLCFGLLAILLAIIISRKRENGSSALWGWWLGLIVACGLAMASKHTSAVFVGVAFGWIGVTEFLRFRWRDLLVTVLKLAVSAGLVLAIFIALSPALWNDPAARLRDLIEVRADLLDTQIQADASAPMPFSERVNATITQPFLTPLAHFEAGGWTDFAPISAEIERYMASPLSGLQSANVIGLALTALTLGGFGLLWLPRWRPVNLTWGQVAGVLVWLAGSVAFALVNPLPWQRYYLPLIPVYALLAGVGIVGLVNAVSRIRSQRSEAPIRT